MSQALWADGTELSKAEAKEVSRLERCPTGRAIQKLGGPGALAKLEAEQDLQRRRQAWVTTHRVSCFGCGMTVGEWAKLGVTSGRRWCICTRCVRKPK